MRIVVAAVSVAIFGTPPAIAQSCNSAPKPIEGISGYRASTLILNGPRSYYELDNCFILSRSQFGSVLKFGFVNNFDKDDVASVGMLFVRSTKTFSGSEPPDRVKLSRGAGWYLQPTSSKSMEELDASYDRPFKGTIAMWNQIHGQASHPEDLASQQSFLEPWHAYADANKRFSSLEQSWTIDPSSLPASSSITNYLIRFSPDKSYALIPLTVQLQRNVTEVRLEIGSNIEALVQEYRFVVR